MQIKKNYFVLCHHHNVGNSFNDAHPGAEINGAKFYVGTPSGFEEIQTKIDTLTHTLRHNCAS